MANLPTENQALVIIDGVLDAIALGGEKAAELYLTALQPEILGIPIVQWLLDVGVHAIVHIIARTEERVINNIVIDVQVNGERSAVITQATALQIALSSGDQGEINKQVDAAAKSYANLIHYDGSHTP